MVLPHQSLEYLKDRRWWERLYKGGAQSHRHRRNTAGFHQSRWIGLRPARLLIKAARRPIDPIARSRKESGTVAGSLDRAISKDAASTDQRTVLDEERRRLALGNLFGRRTVSRESPVRGHSLYSRALSLPKAAIPSSLGPRPRPPPPQCHPHPLPRVISLLEKDWIIRNSRLLFESNDTEARSVRPSSSLRAAHRLTFWRQDGGVAHPVSQQWSP